TTCRVMRMPFAATAKAHGEGLERALDVMERVDTVDLVAVPDLFRPVPDGGLTGTWVSAADALALQGVVLAHCARRGDRFAILDAPPGAGTAEVNEHAAALSSLPGAASGALYYPW